MQLLFLYSNSITQIYELYHSNIRTPSLNAKSNPLPTHLTQSLPPPLSRGCPWSTCGWSSRGEGPSEHPLRTSTSTKRTYFMDVEVRIGFLSMKCRYSMDIEVRIGCLSIKCRCFMDVEVQIGCSARCRACGNSRLCRNVAELASLPFLPNEGACPNHPFSSQHCILERMLVSLTQKHPFIQFHPCQSVSEDRLFYEYDFSDKLGDIFS